MSNVSYVNLTSMSNHAKNDFCVPFLLRCFPKKKYDIDVKILTSLSFPRGQNFVSKPRGKKSIPKNIVVMDFDRSKKYYDRKGTYVY